MKVGFIQCAVISAILAIAGYLLFSSVSLNVDTPLTVAAALLVSGILTPWLASLIHSTSSPDARESNSKSSTYCST